MDIQQHAVPGSEQLRVLSFNAQYTIHKCFLKAIIMTTNKLIVKIIKKICYQQIPKKAEDTSENNLLLKFLDTVFIYLAVSSHEYKIQQSHLHRQPSPNDHHHKQQ